ncbi:MAG: response regulator [Deltaproteobacteria bacterium]|nr:response regulator [Deltaproteobacteria bacterium]
MRLLVVDDNPELLEVLSDAMALFGHEVDTAKDGIDAMDLQTNQHYDIVITDADMPRLDGIELCRFIKTHSPAVKIIGMSGSLALAEFKDAGADFCLSKPFSIDQLRDAVENRLHPLHH